jgi:hypothetical protein
VVVVHVTTVAVVLELTGTAVLLVIVAHAVAEAVGHSSSSKMILKLVSTMILWAHLCSGMQYTYTLILFTLSMMHYSSCILRTHWSARRHEAMLACSVSNFIVMCNVFCSAALVDHSYTANKHALCILQYNHNTHYSSNINNSPQSVSSYNNQRTLSHTFGTYNSNRNDSSDYDDHIDATGRNSAGVRHNSYSRRSSARSNRSSRSGRNASATTTGSGISSSDVHLTANTTANSGANNSNPAAAAAATAASIGNNASSGAQLDESASQQTYDESSALGGSQSSLMSGLGQLYPRDNMPVSPAHSNAPSSIFEAIHGASDEQAGESTDASISASNSGLNSGTQTPFDIKRHPRRPLP